MKFKNILSLSLAFLMTFTATLSSSALTDETVFAGEKETYVILTETAKEGKEIISDHDGKALYSNEAVSCELTERQADKLEDQPGVLAVSEDIILTGTGKKSKNKKFIKNDAPEQWNLDAIGVSESDAKSSDVKIEVLDSGVSYTDDINIQSSVNLVPGEEEVSPMFVDANGHGTGIAGLIGAKDNNDGIKGVFPNAEIYSVKALDENLKSPLSRIVEGIYWGIDNDMDIINMSFGTSVNTDVLHEAVKAAADAGIILIAAAGNTEHQNVNYPAAYNEVIAVGSINAEGELAELTSTGTQLELLAPGEQVFTTGLFYGTIGVSGTSIATAQVTGTAAMLKAKDKTKSADFIRGLLKASSKEVAGTGAGLIDYNYALDIYDEYANSYIAGENIDNEFENTEEISDYSDEADVVVEGLWLKENHKKLVNNAKSGLKLTEKEIELIGDIAMKADSEWGAKITKDGKEVDNINQCYNLHGKSNYVFTLKYLWNFAKKIATISTTIPVKDAAYDASYYSLSFIDRNMFVGEANSKLQNLAYQTQRLIKTYGKSKNGKERRDLVFGFIFHLLGDVYAHRVIVPVKAVEDAGTTKTNSKFGKNDFASNENPITDAAQLKEIAKDASNKVGDKPRVKCWKAFKKTVNLSVMEFRDVKYYMKSKNNNTYEDNTSFCSYRYDESKLAIEDFASSYSGNFDETIFYPICGAVLNNYRGYIKQLKIDTSYMTDKEWDEISTKTKV